MKITDVRNQIDKPKVSVIVPVYNAEKYLRDCLESLVHQTLKEIEIILVNDSSTDNSLAILYEYQKKYPEKIVLIEPSEHIGAGGARNAGMRYAHADWIGFVDNDDIAKPAMFEKMYAKASETNCDMVAIQAATFISNPNESTNIPYITWDKDVLALNGKCLNNTDRKILLVKPVGAFFTRLIRTKFISENNLYFPEKLRFEDNCIGPIMMTYLSKIQFIEEKLYYYRENPNSQSRHIGLQTITDRIQIENLMISEFKKRKLFDEYYHEIEHIGLIRYLCTTSFMILNADIPKKYSWIKPIRDCIRKEYPRWNKNPYFHTNPSKIQKIMIYGIMYCLYPFSLSVKLYHLFKYHILKYK